MEEETGYAGYTCTMYAQTAANPSDVTDICFIINEDVQTISDYNLKSTHMS